MEIVRISNEAQLQHHPALTMRFFYCPYFSIWNETNGYSKAKLVFVWSNLVSGDVAAESSVTKGLQAYCLLLQLLIHTFFFPPHVQL